MESKVIILAAGRGTRMNSEDQPKVLMPVLTRPMIDYVVRAVEKSSCRKPPVIIIGYQGEKIKNYLGERAIFIEQQEQLGTGHAVLCAREMFINFQGAILILYGDHPLISAKTIDKLFTCHDRRSAHISIMTTEVEDFRDWQQSFFYFGRILRDKNGQIKAIRELKDCNEQEKTEKEVNPGYYCFDSAWLWQNITEIKNQNQQREYYLTDLIELGVKQGLKINYLKIPPVECLGVNTREQLSLVENILATNRNI